VRLPGQETSDYAWIVGLRNSHDKTYPAGLVAGSKVFVCDNLCFSGEVRLSRKHTRHAVRDLKHLGGVVSLSEAPTPGIMIGGRLPWTADHGTR